MNNAQTSNLAFEIKALKDAIENSETTAYDIITDAVEIFEGEITITVGGPNIWIYPEERLIVGTWAFQQIEVRYNDNINLWKTLKELF